MEEPNSCQSQEDALFGLPPAATRLSQGDALPGSENEAGQKVLQSLRGAVEKGCNHFAYTKAKIQPTLEVITRQTASDPASEKPPRAQR